ncbi:MAG: chlorohydrolase [Promethearchaeota archaeon]|nr:MAG: chlorohydrolase [Candidatus Lokiarchaeota archaeon]
MKKFDYGLIGDELELKKDISFDIDPKGRIKNLEYNNVDGKLKWGSNYHKFLLIPGLINSHVHIGDSFAKERGYNKDLIEIVAPPNGLKHKLLKNIAIEFKNKGIQNAAYEMITNGITYFIDFREEGLEGVKLLKDALKDSPIKYLILGRFKNYDEIEYIFKEADGIGLSSYKNITPQIKEILQRKKINYKKNISTHHAEVKRNKKRFKKIIKDGLIDVIIHGTHLSANDLKILRKKDIGLVFCPRSNGYFGVGFPPVMEALETSIQFSLGTDNIMNIAPDLFEELRFMYLVFKNLYPKTVNIHLAARELLKTVTINAAKNFQIENNVGSIKEGKDADFFLIDLNESNFYCSNINKSLIYPLIVQRTKPHNIKKVYIRGEKIFERF